MMKITLLFSLVLSIQVYGSKTLKKKPISIKKEKKMTDFTEGLSKSFATLEVEGLGKIKLQFFEKDAPETVKRITKLISDGFYNGIKFHRVIAGFVAQAGDPTGTGQNGSGVKLKAEFNKRKHLQGTLSMARKPGDNDSADSQFYITLADTPHLDGQYTVFGRVVEGFDEVLKIKQDQKIKSFTFTKL